MNYVGKIVSKTMASRVLLQNYSRYLSSVTAGEENQFQMFMPFFKLTNESKNTRIYQIKFVEDSF